MTIEEKAKEYSSYALAQDGFITGMKEATRWIPVEESLPEQEGQYLVEYNGSIMLLWFNTFHECWDDADGDDFYCKPSEVTAWRPLEFE